MKFEHLLKIYWSKGLYFNGKLYKLNLTLNQMFNNLPGLKKTIKYNFIKKFEMTTQLKLISKNLLYFNDLSIDKKKIINIYISQITNTNNHFIDLIKLNLIKLYLIKSFRGRSQFLGKPSRGQRTWSNAWNAFKCNKITKAFVNEIIKLNKLKKTIKKLNYKITKRRLKKQTFKIKLQKIYIKKDLWF